MQKIVLATESSYKKSLFSRLNLNFISIAAKVDEKAAKGENAKMLASRLARTKANKIAGLESYSGHWIIGADQCAETKGAEERCTKGLGTKTERTEANNNEANNKESAAKLVFKPGSHQQAAQDLLSYSGKRLDFYTAVCLISPEGESSELMDKTSVQFRTLTSGEIENYLHIEKPYDCAGAFKAEGLGISLFNSISSEDPSALIGLPLIKLSQFLREKGFDCYAIDPSRANPLTDR